MKLKNRKILLTIDNCPAHKIVSDYSNIEIIFFPPNTTGVLQPLDLGIIRPFKCKFRKELTRNVLMRMENCNYSVVDAYKSITIKDAILFTYFAWEDVSKETIKACFKQSPVFANPNIDGEFDAVNKEEKTELEELVSRLNLEKGITLENLLDIDEENIIVCDIEDSEILGLIKKPASLSELEDGTKYMECSEDVESSDEEPKNITLAEVNTSLNRTYDLYDILKDDNAVPKEVLKNIFNIQKYLFSKKSKLMRTGSLDVWIKKRTD